MKVKNVSARLHHVGDVSIAPGEEKDIPRGFYGSFNKTELVEVIYSKPTPEPEPEPEPATKKNKKNKIPAVE